MKKPDTSLQDAMKRAAAHAALEHLPQGCKVIGVGTGSTVNYFIDALARIKGDIDACVSSSEASSARLKALGIPVLDLNAAGDIDVYVDGADEINHHMHMIKGGGGALTREKIVAEAAHQFICIADQSKYVEKLGAFPLPVEVIPMARSLVARKLVKLGGHPEWRQNFVTDNGNVILDVHDLDIQSPVEMEELINHIPGVVCCGLFARRHADVLLLGQEDGSVTVLK